MSPCSSVRLRQEPCPRQTRPQLLFEAREDRVPTSWQRSDHDPVGRVQLGYDRSRDMAQPPRHPMPLHGRSHRPTHHQTDSWTYLFVTPLRVHDEIPFDDPCPVFHRGPELRRPCHPVPRRKHCPGCPSRLRQSALAGLCVAGLTRSPAPRGSSSEAGIHALVRACGCSAGKSASPWPRHYLLVHLALRRLAHRRTTHAKADAVAVGKLFASLANRRGPRGRTAPVRCRIADFRATV